MDETGTSVQIQDVALDGAGSQLAGGAPPAPVEWTPSLIAWSLFLFCVAGVLEIGGGWLVWVGVRERATRKYPYLFIVGGALTLALYGYVPTLQPGSSFGRTYAVYGGFFIALSYVWGVLVQGESLDKGDYLGASIAFAGVLICWFWPR